MIEPYLVGLGGMIGASLRYLLSTRVDTDSLPLGTFLVNVLGSFGLGLLTFVGVDNRAMLVFGVGLCGSFTTFASFSVDTVRLWEDASLLGAIGYALLTFLGAVIAIGAAWLVAGLTGTL